jgi:hypothetical protein
MLDVLDTLDETGIDIELAKEFFDKKFAPVKAWAAKMELDAKHDRITMGIAGRLKTGKPWNQSPPYGYARDPLGYWIVDEAEAQWLRKIFSWYAAGDSMSTIRQRLIDGGAPQRETRKHVWSPRVIYKYFQENHRWTGVYIYRWDGTAYEIPVPAIIADDVAQRVVARRARFGKYPAGNAKHNCLCAGLVFCETCDVRMASITKSNGRPRKDGTVYCYEFYRCASATQHYGYEGCARAVRSKSVDDTVWTKVWNFISQPEAFEEALQARIAALQALEVDAKTECGKILDHLAGLSLERQRVIGWARKGTISESDLEGQLQVLTGQERELRQALAEKQLLIGDRAERLQRLAESFRAQVAAGIEAINAEPSSEEERKRQLEYRRKIVEAVVERVSISADKSVTVFLSIELPGEMVSIDEPVACNEGTDAHYFAFRVTL